MSRSHRQHILAQIWSTPSAVSLDFLDKGNEVIITSGHKDVCAWWMSIIQMSFPHIRYAEKGDIIKLKPARDVTVKISKISGAMKVYGKSHWKWFVENFSKLMEAGNEDVERLEALSDAATSTDLSVTRFLQLDRDSEEIQDLLDTIPDGGGIMSSEFILRLWRSLLDDWFGVGATVYVVTPKIDAERLFNICLLMIRNKGTGFNVTVVTPQKAHDGEKFKNVLEASKRMMKKTRTVRRQEKRLVSDVKLQWVIDKMVIRNENFSTNFIAGFKDAEAEVLCTTAHFNRGHMQFNKKDNVTYSRMPTSELVKNYLNPLNIGQLSY